MVSSSNSEEGPRRVIEAEVVSEEPHPQHQGRSQPLPPVLAGMLLDLLDFFTAGPIGLFAGLAVGGVGAFVLGTLYKLPLKKKLWFTLAAGVYCSMPGTAPIPLGTLVGAWLGIQGDKPEPGAPVE